MPHFPLASLRLSDIIQNEEASMYDLVILNGYVITPESSGYRDIAIKDGRIAAIADKGKLPDEGREAYDASGKCVMPGLVEPHMHIKAPLGGVVDIMDFDTASRCAAFGGDTTFIDFTSTLPGDSLVDAVEFRKGEMEKSTLDYACHCKVVNLVRPELEAECTVAEARYRKTGSEEDRKLAESAAARVQEAIEARLSEIPRIIRDEGIPTFKLFMTYRKAGVMIDDTFMLKVMAAVRDNGGRVGFHAESNAIAEYNEERFAAEGKLGWEYFPECKGNICEAEAVERVLRYAEMLKAPVYFFHLTCRESVDLIRQAKSRGVDVIAETCTHYLAFNKGRNKGEDGILYLMSPPLRTEADQEALWEGLKDGTLSIVSSDNCTFSRKQKEAPLNGGPADFRKPISGVSGIEERFTFMRHGVEEGRITDNDLVRILSENPARIFGCYPQKGCLAVGSDGDLAIYDPEKVSSLSLADLHYPEELEYSIYDGFSAKGKIVTTIRRGEFLVKDGVYNENASKGRFIRRSLR